MEYGAGSIRPHHKNFLAAILQAIQRPSGTQRPRFKSKPPGMRLPIHIKFMPLKLMLSEPMRSVGLLTRLLPVLTVALGAGLAGCSVQGSADDRLGSFLVAPGKFEFYNCQQMAAQSKALTTREAELKALMAKAGAGLGGGMVSTVAYRPEYVEVHGEINELRKASAEKNCDLVTGAANDAVPPGGTQKR